MPSMTRMFSDGLNSSPFVINSFTNYLQILSQKLSTLVIHGDNALAKSENSGLSSIAELQFAEDIANMCFYSFLADHQ